MEIFDSLTHHAAVRTQPVGKENSDRKKSSNLKGRAYIEGKTLWNDFELRKVIIFTGSNRKFSLIKLK